MNGFIKGKNNNNKIILTYYLNILLLVIYATYKNGVLLYNKGLINFLGIFKPITLVFGSIIISYLVDYLINKYYLKKDNILTILKNDYNPLFIGIVSLSIPININLIGYFFLVFGFNFIFNLFKQDKFNYYALFKIVIVLLLILFQNYIYKNIYELNIETSLTTLDMFLGRSIGGIGTTSSLLLIITYLTFLTIPSYKKDIPIISILIYLLMIIISSFFKVDFITNIKELLNSETLFGFIFIATIPMYSPIVTKDKYIYSILIGVLTFIFNKMFNPFEGIFISIILTNLIICLLNNGQNLKMRYNTLGKRGVL